MPRIRSIKPEIVGDEKTGPLSDAAFRLFTGMIALADDHGTVRADIRWLGGAIWWAHDGRPNVLQAMLELVRAPLVKVYAIRGGTYARLLGWEKHQRIDNASKLHSLPAPNDAGAILISARDLESLERGRDLESLAQPSDLESPTAQLLLESSTDNHNSDLFAESRGENPRESAKFRSDLDLDREVDMESALPRDPSASPPSKPKRGRKSKPSVSLPEDLTPNEDVRELARELDLDLEYQLAKFRDHHAAKGSRFSDWQAAIRNWLRRAAEFGSERGNRPPREQRSMQDL